MAALRDGALDVAFLRPDAVSEEGLRFRTVAREAMVAAVPTGHRLAAEEIAINLFDLSDDPFILTPRKLGPSLYETIVKACREAGFEPVLGQQAPQIASVLALVAAEFGVAVVPASMRSAVTSGVTYLDLLEPAPVAALALATRRMDRSPAVLAFATLVLRAVSSAGANVMD